MTRALLAAALLLAAACGGGEPATEGQPDQPDARPLELPDDSDQQPSGQDSTPLAPRASLRAASAATPDSVRRDSAVQEIDTTWRVTVREWYHRVDTVFQDTSTGGGGTPVVAGTWGPSAFLNSTTATNPAGVLNTFTYSPNENATRASWLQEDLVESRQRNIPVQLGLPCGSHSGDRNSEGEFYKLGNCLRDSSGVAVFSRRRFDSAATAILTAPGVKDSLAKARERGLLVGLQIMDEPWVHGGDDGAGNVVGNTWGPPGTITRARADSLCGFVKKLLPPGVPVGLSDHLTWDPGKQLKVCDFTQPQFSNRFGDIARWRDSILARAAKAGHQTQFSFNILNGGTQDRDGTWDCKDQGGRKGQRQPNCQMTPTQVTAAVTQLGAKTCSGLMMWRYDPTRYSSADYLEVIRQGLLLQKSRYLDPCRVRG